MYVKGEETYYDINIIAKLVGNDTSEALPFFYSFAGCDTISSIFGKGKCKMWECWQNDEKFNELNILFKELGNVPQTVSEEQLDMLEYFINMEGCYKQFSEPNFQKLPNNINTTGSIS